MNDLIAQHQHREVKQLYHALKLRKKEIVFVEIPKAYQDTAKRSSNLITKVVHAIAWFNNYQTDIKNEEKE